uniref:acetyl-CoA carboxylase carboxyltransferase beta subunit n=1 Tax=Fockea edulis TaxID=141482 RepID=UPI002551F0D5|nr:acetyl-CoA carboxylase carboxyltransferase beta subunit [Fockea edulis]WEV91351.1 acetyl-CoA carboxylase carboxyltransferase beta subunit [Fockea edulis]
MTIHLLYFHTNRGQENSMERWWFNSMLFKKELERRCGLNKSMDSLGPIENTGEIEDSNIKDTTQNIQSWGGRDDSSYSNVDRLFGVKDIRNFISNETFLVKDSNGDSYSIYFDIENQIFQIDNNHSFLSELESSFSSYRNSSYLHNESTSEDTYYNNDTQYSWNNYINSCIDSYLQSQICIDTSMVSDIDNCSDSYIYRSICGESPNNGEREGSDGEREGSAGIRTHAQDSDLTLEESSNDSDAQDSDLTLEESSNDSDAQDSDLTLEESSNDSDAQDSDLTLEESSNDREESSNDSDAQDSDLTLEESSNDREESSNDREESSNDREESSNDSVGTHKYKHLWVLCENCYELNYKRFLKAKMNICEECGWHLKMNSSDRIDLSIDPDTWHPMDEDMVSLDPIEWNSVEEEEEEESSKDPIDSDSEEESSKDPIDSDSEEESSKDPIDSHSEEESYSSKDPIDSHSEEESYSSKDPIDSHSEEESSKDPIDSHSEEESSKDPIDSHSEEESSKDPIDSDSEEEEEEEESYKDRIDSYQTETGLPEAVQTGIGQLNGIPVAVGVMDFEFIGGSMGSVVGEKITRLIEYATNQFLPLIIVCASGGARMQEGSVSLMQMAKISSALYDYQSNKKLFYVSILASPTTGGVTASFGMLGDIIIAEPNAYIAFAGKRVIEQTLNITVPEGTQETEYLFEKGLFDLIVPRNLLKSVLTELFKLHAFFPLTQNENQNKIER